MANEIFTGISDLRMVLDTETDADSPHNETTYGAIRKAYESIIMLMVDTNVGGSATSDPVDSTVGTFTDSAGGFTADEHNGRTLLITSGAAKGNFYTIDDGTTSTLICSGDNLYADGVRSGDDYKVLYDLKVNLDGHDHDGINSKNAILADASIANAKLKTSTGSGSGSSVGTRITITAQDYCFAGNYYSQDSAANMMPVNSQSADYVHRIAMDPDSGNNYAYYYRYITASDKPFMYLMRDKSTGKIICLWECDDPPPGYWGLTETPEDFEPPILLTDKENKRYFDPDKHEEIISWNVQKDIWHTIRDRLKANKKTMLPFEVIEKQFEFDKDTKIWKTRNLVTV